MSPTAMPASWTGAGSPEIAIETTKLFFQAHRRAKTAEP